MMGNENIVDRDPVKIGKAIKLINDVLEKMGYSASVIYSQSENAFQVTTTEGDSGLLIGKQGQTLDALQQITNIVVNKGTQEYMPVTVDIDGYRERQRRTIEDLAIRSANSVVDEGVPVTLRPMTAYERRLVHIALHDRDDVETVSYGEDPGRRVTIYPKEESEGTPYQSAPSGEPMVFPDEEQEEDEEEFYVEVIEDETEEEIVD